MTSRFSSLVEAKKKAEPQDEPGAAPIARKARKRTGTKAAPPPGAAPVETETREITVRRAVGKRSKDGYTQVSAYIPKGTHLRAKMALLEDGRDFSELVSDLLAEWLDRRG